MADVGTKAKNVEANLAKIFALATSWQAILLMYVSMLSSIGYIKSLISLGAATKPMSSWRAEGKELQATPKEMPWFLVRYKKGYGSSGH